MDNSYEVIIGGWDNTESAIRDVIQGDDLVRVSTSNILNCNDERWFWVKLSVDFLGLTHFANKN